MIKDILYFGHDYGSKASANAHLQDAFMEEVKEKFPNAKLRNCFSSVDGHRQGITIEDVAQEDYLLWIIARGWGSCSFELAQIKSTTRKGLRDLVDKAKKQYPEAFSE